MLIQTVFKNFLLLVCVVFVQLETLILYTMDIIFNLINVKTFLKYTYYEKIELKKKGRPLPDIIIQLNGSSRGKTYQRKFSRAIYDKTTWICGCNKTNALFCFPCVLYNGDKAWAEVGVTDLVHLSEKLKTHENSKRHIYNSIELALLGTDIKSQLNPAFWKNLQEHNENVMKNRYLLMKVIDSIKFCGAFDLALREQDEPDPGIFRGLINFSAELDSTLGENLKNASVFKGNFKEIQNELLDCMLEICHEELIKEIRKASVLAIMVDETSDIQLAVIFRYIRNGEPVERFWSYINPEKFDAETISKIILNILTLTQVSPMKVIAQSYDGAMSGQHGEIQAKIKEKYPFAYFVHSYDHQLNSIISKAASVKPQVRVFFGNLQDIPTFFNNSPQRIQEMFNIIVKRKNPNATVWNFNIHTVNVVFQNIESVIELMEEIVENFNQTTVCSAANSIRRTLQDPVFVFWLTFFHHVMPHVDNLFEQLQKSKNDPTHIESLIFNFEQSILHIRSTIDGIVNQASDISAEQPPIKRKHPGNVRFDNCIAALEVCDIITNSIKDRFFFKDHLLIASLFFPERFKQCNGKLPENKITAICSAYPFLEKDRLRAELSVIYSRSDCRQINGALPFLKFLIQNNLDETMRETKKLLEIVVTTPMATDEPERCFSTLKRIKTFLRNTMSEDRLTALSMISIEKKFISEIDKFNEKVIDKFASKKNRRIDLIYENKFVNIPDKEKCEKIPKKRKFSMEPDEETDPLAISSVNIEEAKIESPDFCTNEEILTNDPLENEELTIKNIYKPCSSPLGIPYIQEVKIEAPDFGTNEIILTIDPLENPLTVNKIIKPCSSPLVIPCIQEEAKFEFDCETERTEEVNNEELHIKEEVFFEIDENQLPQPSSSSVSSKITEITTNTSSDTEESIIPIYQFKITLLIGKSSNLWRCIQVPKNYTFRQLHVAIQRAMGWKSVDFDYHLHIFNVKNLRTGATEAIIDVNDSRASMRSLHQVVKNENTTPIVDYFIKAGQIAKYNCDFGMGWGHQILLEKILRSDPQHKYPRCVAGQTVCPPEKGIGYANEEFNEDEFDPNLCFP